MGLRAARCANCGRDVRGLADARSEGRDWFCSQSCFLQASSSATRASHNRPAKQHRGAGRIVRTTIKWSLITLGLILALGAVLALAGVGDDPAPKKAKRSGTETGTLSKPVRLGRAGGAWGGWRLRVLGVDRRTHQLLGDEPRHIERGAQVVRLAIAAKLAKGGHARIRNLLDRISVTGSHNVAYSPDYGDLNCASRGGAKPEPPLNETNPDIFSEQATRGHLCFTIAKNDAATLALAVNAPSCDLSGTVDTCTDKVWFALR